MFIFSSHGLGQGQEQSFLDNIMLSCSVANKYDMLIKKNETLYKYI